MGFSKNLDAPSYYQNEDPIFSSFSCQPARQQAAEEEEGSAITGMMSFIGSKIKGMLSGDMVNTP